MASLLAKSTLTRGKDEVYVAAVPLRATKGAPQLLMSAAYSFNFWDLQHFMVIIKSRSPPSPSQAFLVFDFQPKDPENIFTALAVLSGRAVPGAVLTRKLTKLPRSKCWLIGSSQVDALSVANKFSCSWETDLRVGFHDCRDYTNGDVIPFGSWRVKVVGPSSKMRFPGSNLCFSSLWVELVLCIFVY